MPSPTGVIFDMDGLMVDTERIAKIAWQETSRRFGHEMPDAVFAQMIGRSKRDSGDLMRLVFWTGTTSSRESTPQPAFTSRKLSRGTACRSNRASANSSRT